MWILFPTNGWQSELIKCGAGRERSWDGGLERIMTLVKSRRNKIMRVTRIHNTHPLHQVWDKTTHKTDQRAACCTHTHTTTEMDPMPNTHIPQRKSKSVRQMNYRNEWYEVEIAVAEYWGRKWSILWHSATAIMCVCGWNVYVNEWWCGKKQTLMFLSPYNSFFIAVRWGTRRTLSQSTFKALWNRADVFKKWLWEPFSHLHQNPLWYH